jgi:hypothetical protein
MQPAKGDTAAAGGSGAMQRVTVVPQLPCAESNRCCIDFCSANLHALVQMEAMLQHGEGGLQRPAFERGPHCGLG